MPPFVDGPKLDQEDAVNIHIDPSHNGDFREYGSLAERCSFYPILGSWLNRTVIVSLGAVQKDSLVNGRITKDKDSSGPAGGRLGDRKSAIIVIQYGTSIDRSLTIFVPIVSFRPFRKAAKAINIWRP